MLTHILLERWSNIWARVAFEWGFFTAYYGMVWETER